jgi:hypothetical protein
VQGRNPFARMRTALHGAGREVDGNLSGPFSQLMVRLRFRGV